MSAATFQAIAAMSLNRVIGNKNNIPWHLPEDFKWFKKTTMGHVLVMGRKTFNSIGRPLPGRDTVVLTRNPESIIGIPTFSSIAAFEQADEFQKRKIFICGGAEIYRQTLEKCSDLFLTLVKQKIDGDTFFPDYESLFDTGTIIHETEEFDIIHYRQLKQAHHPLSCD
ncbi:MAG: dihydrofolate reductase [Verrucomicrobiota bacterium]|jgi:dihydrofolate reductase|nr:dihydrofolate reductase [Verrucomicrobiota bacterium]